MTRLATASVTSSASAEAFFARWGDMATWPEWNLDTEWVRLDGPFVEGATGVLKPKGGPKVPFVVEHLVLGREFTDVSKLAGARLTFRHLVEQHDSGCTISVEATLTGPLAPFWRLVLGKGIRTSMQPDLERLAAVAERASVAS